jgi:hypothetical protein
MLNVALSQVETRSVQFVAITALPLAVALSGDGAVQFDISAKVPGNEQWLFSAGGLRLAADDARLLVTGGISFITLADGNVIPTAAIIAASAGGAAGWISISLQGVVLPPGSNLSVLGYVHNSDAAGAHNITVAGTFAGAIVQPLRLMTDIETAQLVYQRSPSGLDARLRGARG